MSNQFKPRSKEVVILRFSIRRVKNVFVGTVFTICSCSQVFVSVYVAEFTFRERAIQSIYRISFM